MMHVQRVYASYEQQQTAFLVGGQAPRLLHILLFPLRAKQRWIR